MSKLYQNKYFEYCALLAISISISLLVLPSHEYLVGGDFFHSIWSYKNNIDNLLNGNKFYETNILYSIDVKALFHELSPLNTALYFPFYISGSYLTGISFIYFIHTLATIIAFGMLAKNLGVKSNYLALAAGIAVIFPTFRLTHASHLQLLSTELIGFGVLFVFKWIETGQRKWLFAIYALYVIIFCGPSYVLVSLCLFLLIFSIVYMISASFEIRRYIALVLVLFAAILSNYPVLKEYIEVAQLGYVRSIKDAGALGTDLSQLFLPIKGGVYEGFFGGFKNRADDICNYFPGYVILFAILISLMKFLTGGKELGRELHMTKQHSIILWSLLLVLVSFGPEIKYFSTPLTTNPFYLFFYQGIPLLKATRYIPYYGFVALGFLTVIAFKGLQSWLQGRFAVVVVLAVLLATFIENRNFSHLEWQKNTVASTFESQAIVGYKQLNGILGGETAAIISLPFNGYVEYNYMFYTFFHNYKIFNGQDGFNPRPPEVISIINSFPSQSSTEFLKSKGIGAIVVHRSTYMSDCRQYAIESQMSLKYKDSAICVFQRDKTS